MLGRLREIRDSLARELSVYRCVLADPRTPWLSKVLLWLAVAYLLLPFDLIPDWIPLLGQLDDLIVVPLLVIAAMRGIPHAVVDECRANSRE